MKNSSLKATIIALTGAGAAAAPGIANACAMCGLSPGDSAGHAYNTSVLFMLIGPYFTLAAMVGILFVAYRRSLRRGAEPSIVKR
jgi:hypothetical protein